MWHSSSIEEIAKNLKTNINIGLPDDEAQKRFERYGPNNLKEKKKESLFVKFIKQFNDFMIITLIIAAIISAVVSKLNGEADYIDSIIIVAIVIFNAIMGLVQEQKAEKSLEALKKMTAPNAKVRRDGRVQEIDATLVVPGDIVVLEAGNYVPADCRLINSYNLKIEESALTGETIPSLKDSSKILKENTAMGDLCNMVFATTIVVNGHGEAIVVETGMNTRVGKIAGMIIEDESPETPIQKKLAEVGKILAIACIIICVLIFVIGIFKKIPIIEMFMTSVGLAVAAIPEGLPAIVTIMLSIGVTKMAKKNSIIRKLPAVETLGSSSVICSDKTGTLTQNKMTVTEIRNCFGRANSNERKFILELGKTLPADKFECREDNIWIAKSAKVAPTACINGPAIIGKNTEVRHCAFIRGKALVGEGCVVGNSTELKNVVLFNNVQVPHYNYVGDAVLGYKSHMGAGSICSNVKSDKKLVVVKDGEEKIETGLKKFGAMLADYVEVGCGSVLNPGTVIGRNTNIYPLSPVRGCVPANSIYKNKDEIVTKN